MFSEKGVAADMQEVWRERTAYHEIRIVETTFAEGRSGKFRLLQFADMAIQGAIDLEAPRRVVLAYPQAILHLIGDSQRTFQELYVIGHGIGTIPAHCEEQGLSVKIAELDHRIASLSREWFGYNGPDVTIGDGRALLQELKGASLDGVIVDAFSASGTPRQLITLEFFQLARTKLRDYGILILNLAGRRSNDRLVAAIRETAAACYAYTEVFAPDAMPASEVCNILIAASDSPIRFSPAAMAGFQAIPVLPGYVIYD
ncbi:spermidine synthase [Paenibacillus sp. 1P07SE]|uniref:spermidine synthase n=1 Tax=Paenibacillus sp. 1P07SE TaxID=3132209 RepID=UPI0039A475EE